MLLNFAAQVYTEQLKGGRHFLHEHPASATSWGEPCMQRLLRTRGVSEVVADQCRFGLAAKGPGGGYGPARKPTRFLSSAPRVLGALGLRCNGEHAHVPLVSGRAAVAAVYPRELCRAILRGIAAQRRREGQVPLGVVRARVAGSGLYSLEADDEKEYEDAEVEGEDYDGDEINLPENDAKVGDEAENMLEYGGAAYWDESTGEALPPKLVEAARWEEIEFMRRWQVWDEVPIAECLQRTGKRPISAKWVDVNKGDLAAPAVRSRLVAREIAHHRNDDYYAATPPLEALRMLASVAASTPACRILVMDASKAHLHASVGRLIYIDLPPEIRKPGQRGKLRRCLYGTRDAPARWEAFLAEVLRSMGFVQGLSSPCCFYHEGEQVRRVVHGDDFTFAGSAPALARVEAQMHEKVLDEGRRQARARALRVEGVAHP